MFRGSRVLFVAVVAADRSGARCLRNRRRSTAPSKAPSQISRARRFLASRHGHQHRHRRHPRRRHRTSAGVYRAPLLPLGSYRVVAELQGFKKFEQQGLTLSAGQTAVINVTLEVGSMSETVTVTRESPIAEPGKIDLGRTIGEAEIRNLPLVSRNPYNFAFLQANVTGYENNEFGVPRINANGIADAHELPDRRQHQHREGPRRPAPAAGLRGRWSARSRSSPTASRPSSARRPGMVYNAITPSGTNDLHGLGELPLQAQRDVVDSRSSSPRPRASPTPRPTTSRPRSAGRSRRTSGTSTAATSTWTAASSPAAR